MADVRETFPVLEDANGEGVALREIQEGDSAALKSGSLGFSFKDASGNAVLPTLTANGSIPTSSGAAATPLLARGQNAGSVGVDVDIAVLTLTANEKYEEIRANVSCFRESIFQIVQVDDATTTVLDEILVGPGQYTFSVDLKEYLITAGASGTQELKVIGQNLQKSSTMRARISASELL